MNVEWHLPGIPKGYPSTIVSPSGGGKTRLTLSWLDALIDGRPILDEPTSPTRVCYVACDRPSSYTQLIMEQLAIDQSRIPLWSFMDEENEAVPLDLNGLFAVDSLGVQDAKQAAKRIPPGTQLCLLEAVGVLDPGPAGKESGYRAAVRFMRRLMTHKHRPRGVDFLLTSHPPKLKVGEAFASSRNTGIGSVGLPATTSTVVELQITGPLTRTAHFNVHLGPDFDVDYELEEGFMVAVPRQADQRAREKLGEWLNQQTSEPFRRKDLLVYAEDKQCLTATTVDRWLRNMVKLGLLEQPGGRGLYRRRRLA
jgi:hypothetical protein